MALNYPYQNFYEMISSNAISHPNNTVIFIDDDKVTHAEFLKKVDSFARFLEISGVHPDDRVALITPNSEEFAIAVFAATKIGAVAVPINSLLKESEYIYILNDCEAKILITSIKMVKQVKTLHEQTQIKRTLWIDEAPIVDQHHMVFDEIANIKPHKEEKFYPKKLDDLAIIFYTSGTTGNPKGAMISYRNIFSNLDGAFQTFSITPKDRFIVYLPMFHAFTFSIMVMLPFYAKASFIIIRSIMPFSNIIKQTLLKRVTIFLGVPDIYNALIRAKLPWYFLYFNSLRAFISGASALSEDTFNRYTKVFSKAKMLEGYGLSECSPAVCINPLNQQKTLSVGKALPGYEVKVVDDEMIEVPRGQVGEIIVHGDCVMMGYLNNPEATADTIINGWLRTGDLGKMDEDGFIYIVDRMKDLIISKGINIYPRQIEEELMKIEYIKGAAVIGVKDSNSGEVPIAYVELDSDMDISKVTPALIKSTLKQHLANFKLPKVVNIVDELPKTATGKILKRILKEEYISQGEE
jgi:long-chain acyl-CoA synthetase